MSGLEYRPIASTAKTPWAALLEIVVHEASAKAVHHE
jgi:hypothetical protein